MRYFTLFVITPPICTALSYLPSVNEGDLPYKQDNHYSKLLCTKIITETGGGEFYAPMVYPDYLFKLDREKSMVKTNVEK